MTDRKPTLPGSVPNPDEKKAADAARAKELVCYHGCSVNLGIKEEGGKPELLVLEAGEVLTKEQRDKIGSTKLKSLATMGRIVEADSTEGRYIVEKIKRLKDQEPTREVDPAEGAKR